MKLALATCARYSRLPVDERILMDAFVSRGIDARAKVWNDGKVQWSAFDAVVIRSTWDYHLDVEQFSKWVDWVSGQTTLINDPVLVHWNSHKQYLTELQASGISIVPTRLLRRGEHRSVAQIMEEFGVDEIVIKPAISASGHRTLVVGAEYAPLETGDQFLRESVADHDTLVQPFLREIFDPGERSLMFFGGAFSHCVLRPPLSAGAAAGKSLGALLDPVPAEVDFAREILALLDRTPVYARVDIVPLRSGSLVLAELELIEPSLYFGQQPASADLFVEAVLRRLDKGIKTV